MALANYMRRDLVETRGWISESEYDSGLAIAAACPGPLAYQLGVYCGYVRFGVLGGLLVAVAFGLTSSQFLLAHRPRPIHRSPTRSHGQARMHIMKRYQQHGWPVIFTVLIAPWWEGPFQLSLVGEP